MWGIEVIQRYIQLHQITAGSCFSVCVCVSEALANESLCRSTRLTIRGKPHTPWSLSWYGLCPTYTHITHFWRCVDESDKLLSVLFVERLIAAQTTPELWGWEMFSSFNCTACSASAMLEMWLNSRWHEQNMQTPEPLLISEWRGE